MDGDLLPSAPAAPAGSSATNSAAPAPPSGSSGSVSRLDAAKKQALRIIDGLKEKNFQGDTTISIDGGTVHVTRTGDKMEVKVEMKDSLEVEEKTVEVHAH